MASMRSRSSGRPSEQAGPRSPAVVAHLGDRTPGAGAVDAGSVRRGRARRIPGSVRPGRSRRPARGPRAARPSMARARRATAMRGERGPQGGVDPGHVGRVDQGQQRGHRRPVGHHRDRGAVEEATSGPGHHGRPGRRAVEAARRGRANRRWSGPGGRPVGPGRDR